MKHIDTEKILTWFEDTFQDSEIEDWYHNKFVDGVVAPYTTKDKLKEELSDIINSHSLQQEQPNNMIQWTGNNLKEVIDFTGKSPRLEEWFKSWEEYEKYVHSHNDILKLFCDDGSHYDVPVYAWIVKTPDGHIVPSITYLEKQEQPEVDLVEEITRFFSKNPIPYEHITDWPLLKNTAMHFYKLGLNARKEE